MNVTKSSAMARCEFCSVASIGESSFDIVPIPMPSAIVAFTGLLRLTTNASSSSLRVSTFIWIVIGLVVCPGEIVTAPVAGVQSSTACAVSSAVAQLTVICFPLAADKLTVRIRFLVPKLPSNMLTSLIDTDGGGSSSSMVAVL